MPQQGIRDAMGLRPLGADDRLVGQLKAVCPSAPAITSSAICHVAQAGIFAQLAEGW